ncbi:spore germination protein KA [Paenibacillus marchantiophytorum]|uniref:Spore germination protein KA n=1 Tax=Paenibacillus marchantiophytorum TaxID=1619310 RepID=A0ABQ1ELR9_9BACL|nr:spore germination protein [Paenibacillus marchantiophytorum]GFZ77632.1 spore germination protein KA [Paenibacillus marchantiophytorum]
MNIQTIHNALGGSPDLIIRQMVLINEWQIALFYMNGLTDIDMIQSDIIGSLIDLKKLNTEFDLIDADNPLAYLKEQTLSVGDIGSIQELSSLFTHLLSGDAILLMDGYAEGLRIGVTGREERTISEPTSQPSIRGPMDAFTENIKTNISLIRRRIKNPHLWLEVHEIGEVTKTSVAIMYISQIADDHIIQEARHRLSQINIDGILESGYIEEFIQDKSFTPFPTVYNTERPDTIAAGLLEGRIAILIDGTPFVLLVPALFVHFMQTSEDYYQRADISTLIRVIRYLSFLIVLLVPSMYIAITTYHQEMLPTNLLLNLAAQREGVPFPAFIEALLMEIIYEILREAGIRMPRTVGQAVSIVGTLVIGQSAVEAGIISAAVVIIVSITAISSYVIPANAMSISVRMIRFVLMGLAASFGLFGILSGIIILALHLNSLRSFGIPYMSPLAPIVFEDQKDTLFRLAWPRMITRPRLFNQKDKVRQQASKHK